MIVTMATIRHFRLNSNKGFFRAQHEQTPFVKPKFLYGPMPVENRIQVSTHINFDPLWCSLS